MLIPNGEEKLRAFAQRNEVEQVLEVAEGVWFVRGLGHSNAVFVRGAHGVILIDTLDTRQRGEALRALIAEKTGLAVKTVIYTHGHPDHRGGAAAFTDTAEEIIAFAPESAPLARSEKVNDILARRAARQFGYGLTDEETLTQGPGRREGITHGEERGFVPPTTVYTESRVERCIDGVTLEMVRLPGENDDEIMVWLPAGKVLCCADNFFGMFPNLYAIRGGQYRDVARWIEGIDTLRGYHAEALLPGHTAPVLGVAEIENTLRLFRDAMDYLLTATLDGLNAGKTADELAASIRLPEELAALPFLGEHYGCAEWSVRAICAAYVGWFDGNPTALHSLPPRENAEKTVVLMGGIEQVLGAAREALEDGQYQWCAQLCDLLLPLGTDAARPLKASALEGLAAQETSANGRHYYLSCAKELRNE